MRAAAPAVGSATSVVSPCVPSGSIQGVPSPVCNQAPQGVRWVRVTVLRGARWRAALTALGQHPCPPGRRWAPRRGSLPGSRVSSSTPVSRLPAGRVGKPRKPDRVPLVCPDGRVQRDNPTTLRVGAEAPRWSATRRWSRCGGSARTSGRGLREARVLQPRRLGQGPDRGGDDRRRRSGRADRARALGDRRADQRQHRDRPGDGLRGARLRADPHPAGGDEPRAGEAAARLRRRGARDAVAGRDERGGRAGRARSASSATASCRSSSPTPPTPRSTGAPPRRRSGATPTARSTPSSPGSAPAARSPASARCCKERAPGGAGRRGRAGDLAGALRRRARARTRSRGSAPASSPRCSTAR